MTDGSLSGRRLKNAKTKTELAELSQVKSADATGGPSRRFVPLRNFRGCARSARRRICWSSVRRLAILDYRC